MEECIVGDLPLHLQTKCPACVQISIIPGEITARHLNSELMPCLKNLGCCLHINFKAIDLSWMHQCRLSQRISITCSQNPIADGHGAAIWPDIAETYHPVCIRG